MSVMINGNSIAINLDRVSLDANIGNTTHKTQDMENSDFEKLLNKITGGEIAQEIRDKLDIENPIIRINTAFKGCSSLEKISVLPRIYHN